MPLLTMALRSNDGTPYVFDLDFLFYGHWQLLKSYFEASFPLFYAETPKVVDDPNANNGYGTYTINGQNPVVVTPDAFGTATPHEAQVAGDILADVGKRLQAFQGSVLQWNAKELNNQWEGPAHEALQRVLTGFDHWVSDALQLAYSGTDPRGQGYDIPTYNVATAHRAAQEEFKRIGRVYRETWEQTFKTTYEALWYTQEHGGYWYSEGVFWYFRKEYFQETLDAWSIRYKNDVKERILDPSDREYETNQSNLSRAYLDEVPHYVSVPASPWFEPAPKPKVDKKKDDTFNVKIDAPKFDPPKFDAPKFDPPKFDAPNFDPPNFDPPSPDSLDSSGSGLPDLDGTGGLDPGGTGGLNGGTGGLDPAGTGGPGSVGTGGLGGLGAPGLVPPGLGATGEQGRGRGLVTGPDGKTGFDVTGDGIPDLGLDGKPLPGGGLPPESRIVTGPDGTRGVDVDGDGIPDVGLDGRTLDGGSLPPDTRLVTGPDGQTGFDVTGDGVPDIGLDGKPLPGGGLPPGSELVTGPDGTRGIDLDGDGIPDVDMNGWALEHGSLPPGTHLVTGPDGTTGFDVTGDGIPDFSPNGEWLPNRTFVNDPGALGSGQSVLTPDDLRGSPGTGQPSGIPVAGTGSPMMPMIPPMGMGGMGGMGGGGQNQNNERERQTWLLEEDAVWRGNAVEPTAVLGRPVEEEDEPEPDEWEAPPKTRGGRKPAPSRPGQRPPAGGWPQSRANR